MTLSSTPKESLLYFFYIFIFLTTIDIISTLAALKTNAGTEGNMFMSKIVSIPLLFITIKIIGVIIIMKLYQKIIEKNTKIAYTGMRIICILMLFVVGNNLFVISANAIQFDAFDGTSGAIANGNGYFNDDSDIFNLSTVRNIYTVTETAKVWLVEPIGFSLSQSSAIAIMNIGSSNLIYGMVASDGYLYYADSQGVKKKISRDNTGVPYANDTSGSSKTSVVISSVVPNKLVEFEGNIYFNEFNTGRIYSFPLDGSYTVTTYFSGLSFPAAFEMLRVNNVPTVIYWRDGSGTGDLYSANSSDKGFNIPNIDPCGVGTTYIFQSQNYLLAHLYGCGEFNLYASNISLKSVNTYLTSINLQNSAYLGGYSNVGLYADSPATYNTFTFIESGISHETGAQPSGFFDYTAKTIEVPAEVYYNNSKIPINYDLRFIVSSENYTTIAPLASWGITVEDPQGIQVDYDIKALSCSINYPWWYSLIPLESLIFDNSYYCESIGGYFYTPNKGEYWINGTYTVSLFEKYLNTKAVLASDSWNILANGTQSIGTPINNPGADIQKPAINNTIDFLGSKGFIALIIFIGCIAVGATGGVIGVVIAFMGSIPLLWIAGLIPLWIVFLDAGIILLSISVIVGMNLSGKKGG
jgi:hypothetical protein